MRDLDHVRSLLRERFPLHPHIYFGISGTALLYEALRSERRASMILPAFLCPSLSAMALEAGKSVRHIDADPASLHPRPAELETYLARKNPADCALLIDHSFGYPYPGFACLRSRFPALLIVEDCARALGASIHGEPAGSHSDWLLLSMYKTVIGSNHGAVLLSRQPLGLRDHPAAPVTWRERAAGIGALRRVHDLAERRRSAFQTPDLGLKSPCWTPAYGSPNRLCLARFTEELEHLDRRAENRRSIAAEMTEQLSAIAGIDCVRVAHPCASAGHFVSFRMRDRETRDRALLRLHKQGLFLSRTWDLLPMHYEIFAGTFAGGAWGSENLWNRIAHIPVRLFLDPNRRGQLIQALRRTIDSQ